jgi:hypothetical protein
MRWKLHVPVVLTITIALRKIQAFGLSWDMELIRDGGNLKMRITDMAKNTLYEKSLPMGEAHCVNFKNL